MKLEEVARKRYDEDDDDDERMNRGMERMMERENRIEAIGERVRNREVERRIGRNVKFRYQASSIHKLIMLRNIYICIDE